MPTASAVDRSVPQQRIVRLVWALCGLAIALAVSALVLQVLGPRPVAAPVLVQDGLLVALEILCVIVGALISVHRPGNRIGGLLLAGAFALSVFSFLDVRLRRVPEVTSSWLRNEPSCPCKAVHASEAGLTRRPIIPR